MKPETSLQISVIQYLSSVAEKYDLVLWAPLNETARMIFGIFGIDENSSARIIGFLKKMGLLPGVPDIQIITKHGINIFIELKSKTGKLSKMQELVIAKLKCRPNCFVFVCREFEEVKEIVEKYSDVRS